MNNYHSKKIKIISFITMIMVMFIHSFNYTLLIDENFQVNTTFVTIQSAISFLICRIAVPFFFILSAYLLLFNYQLTFQSYLNKLKTRFKSLFVPFFIWTVLWSSFFYGISQIHFLSNYINNPIDQNNSAFNIIVNVFQNPICYQFWFIKDLIFLILLSPILYFGIKKVPFIILPMLYLNFIFDYYKFPIFQNLSLLFFSIGILIHLYGNLFIKFIKKINYKFIGLFWISSWFLPEFSIYNYKNVAVFLPYTILMGITFVWKLYDNLNPNSLIIKFLDNNAKYSFFLFAFHEPTMISLKKISFALFGKSNEVRIIIYFLIPIMVFIVAIQLAKLTQKIIPNLYKIATGGRG